MNPASFTLTEQTKSLVHWLSLSGVLTETGEELHRWTSDPFATPDVPSPAARTTTVSAPVPAAAELDVKFDNINELNNFFQQWKRLGISKTATNTLIGTGIQNPCLMIVCDTPDGFEDQKGQPFSGPGNSLIREALRYAGFSLDTIYMTYLSKWRPPGQKALSPTEIGILSPLLHQEIAFIRPQAVLAIGESTLKGLGIENLRPGLSNREISIYKNQYLNYEIPVLTSQKGEFLVKTSSMKKNFWLSITNFASALRAKGIPLHAHGSNSVNYTE